MPMLVRPDPDLHNIGLYCSVPAPGPHETGEDLAVSPRVDGILLYAPGVVANPAW